MLRHPPGSPPPTPKLRVLIVDDEPLARSRVRAFLERDATLEIAGECACGTSALAAIERDRPDIVFLDMQMPGCAGLQVVAQIPEADRPAIVFITAHDRFAVEAFAAHAVDYLLKPFDTDRLQTAVQRARRHLAARRTDNLSARIEALLGDAHASAASPEPPRERLSFKTDGRIVFLRPAEIVWVEAANNYSILHLADPKRLMLRETLTSLESRLRAHAIVRINRSALVRLDEVRELQPANYGDYTVVLRSGLRLPLSRALRGHFGRFLTHGI